MSVNLGNCVVLATCLAGGFLLGGGGRWGRFVGALVGLAGQVFFSVWCWMGGDPLVAVLAAMVAAVWAWQAWRARPRLLGMTWPLALEQAPATRPGKK
ncbi:MAG: hypothetical protein AB7D57_07720 [Desulfovibrionaceae bacterium]